MSSHGGSESALFNLGAFTSGQRLRERWRVGVWFVTSHLLVYPWFVPMRLRLLIVRIFGAKLGSGTRIREHVYIHMPWNLWTGPDVWIGRGTTILNHARIEIENDVCVSQEVLLCSSSHDKTSESFAYAHAPIRIGAHSWVAARAVVLPGANLPPGTVVASGTVYESRGAK